MGKRKTKNKEISEYPEVVDFLRVSRVMIRQMNLLESTNIPPKYMKMTVNAAVSVAEETVNFANEHTK